MSHKRVENQVVTSTQCPALRLLLTYEDSSEQRFDMNESPRIWPITFDINYLECRASDDPLRKERIRMYSHSLTYEHIVSDQLDRFCTSATACVVVTTELRPELAR